MEWTLSRNPDDFDVIEGLKDVRTLKTDPLGGLLPCFRVWFRICDGDQTVELLDIEPIPDRRMTHEIRKDAEDRFRSFISKLVRVPKHEIDEKEREYQRDRKLVKESQRSPSSTHKT